MNWYPHFLIHGAIGAAVMCAAFQKSDRRTLWWIAAISFIVGILPDIPIPAWYTIAHTGWLAWAMIWIPPWGLHVLYDIPLHKVGDWWSTYWWLEISLWIISLFTLWHYLTRKGSVTNWPRIGGRRTVRRQRVGNEWIYDQPAECGLYLTCKANESILVDKPELLPANLPVIWTTPG